MKRNYLAAMFIICIFIAPSPLWAAEQLPAMVTKDYVIGPSDVLDISVWNNEALTRSVTVLPDGKIYYPLIGEVKVGGKMIGLEVKTFLDNTNDKATVHKESRKRKEKWARKHKAKIGMVILDDRDRWEDGAHKEKWSGHRMYFKNKVGACRLSTMEKVKDAAHLLELIRKL